MIPPADRMLMGPGHKARKNPSDYADLGFQAVGPALRIMQLNVEGLSVAKRLIREEEDWVSSVLIYASFYLLPLISLSFLFCFFT